MRAREQQWVVRGRVRAFLDSWRWEIVAGVVLVTWLVVSWLQWRPPPPPPPRIKVEVEATRLDALDGAVRCAPLELPVAPADWPHWMGPGEAPRVGVLEATRAAASVLDAKLATSPKEIAARLDAGFEQEVLQMSHAGCTDARVRDDHLDDAPRWRADFAWTPASKDSALRTATLEIDAELVDHVVFETERTFVARVKPHAWPASLAARLTWARRFLPKLFVLRTRWTFRAVRIELAHRALANDEALLLTSTRVPAHKDWDEEVRGLVDAQGVTLVFDRVSDGFYDRAR